MTSPVPSKRTIHPSETSPSPVSTPTRAQKPCGTFTFAVPTTPNNHDEAQPLYPTIRLERPPFRGSYSDPQPSRVRRAPTILQPQEHRGKRPKTAHAGRYRQTIVHRPQVEPKTSPVQDNREQDTSTTRQSSSTEEQANLSSTKVEEMPSNEFVPSRKSDTGQPKYKPQDIHEELRSRLRKALQNNPDTGVVYILRNKKRPHLLKIGATKDFKERRRQIEQDCMIKTDIVDVVGYLQYFLRAEALIQCDLMWFCRPEFCRGKCKTKKNHKEWFEIDEKLAIATVKRWVDFMKRQPYNSKGELKSVWRHILDKRNLVLPETYSNEEGHQHLWNHWTTILSPPSWVDYYESSIIAFKTDSLIILGSEFFWQISCVLSWLVTFHAFRNRIVGVALLVFIVCAGRSISSHLNKVKLPTSKGRK